MAKNNWRIAQINNSRVILKWNRLGEVLTSEEKLIMNKLLGKIIEYDENKKEEKNDAIPK